MNGLLNLHKPRGPTSRDVVNCVQRLVRPAKVGHAGTLDPLATGVLIVAIGAATRLIEYVQRGAKRYRATFVLGRSSDTEDIEGEVLELSNPPRPTRDEIVAALPRFVGQIQQVPPAYSALKVDGRRAYDRARRGEQVTLAARGVTVHRLELLNYEYPELRLEIDCGSGTYVRSLGRDLAISMGTAAIMSELERTAVGPFAIDDALPLERLNDELAHRLQPALAAVADWPRMELTPTELVDVRHGRAIANRLGIPCLEIAAIDSFGRLVALLMPSPPASLRPILTLPSE